MITQGNIETALRPRISYGTAPAFCGCVILFQMKRPGACPSCRQSAGRSHSTEANRFEKGYLTHALTQLDDSPAVMSGSRDVREGFHGSPPLPPMTHQVFGQDGRTDRWMEIPSGPGPSRGLQQPL